MVIKTAVFSLLAAVTSSAQPAYNSDYVYSPIDSLLWKGIMQVYADNYDSALTIFYTVIEADSASPRGYFFVAATYSNLVSDFRNFSHTDDFFERVNTAIEIGEQKDKSETATAEDLFYYGGAVGYRGIFRSFRGDWWGAFKDGLRGRKLLKKAFEMDSTYKDIYLGLGVYDYWRSAKTKILWWLPFFSDKRKQGIEEIWKGIREGKFSGHEGKYSLIRIYWDFGEYDKLFEIWENDIKKLNTDDTFALYWVGLGYIETDQYMKALECFKKILIVYLRSPYYDPTGEMECRYFLGLCYSELGMLDEALYHLKLSSLIAEQLPHRNDKDDVLKKVEPLLKSVQKRKSETRK